jgi:hypothetical protein
LNKCTTWPTFSMQRLDRKGGGRAGLYAGYMRRQAR